MLAENRSDGSDIEAKMGNGEVRRHAEKLKPKTISHEPSPGTPALVSLRLGRGSEMVSSSTMAKPRAEANNANASGSETNLPPKPESNKLPETDPNQKVRLVKWGTFGIPDGSLEYYDGPVNPWLDPSTDSIVKILPKIGDGDENHRRNEALVSKDFDKKLEVEEVKVGAKPSHMIWGKDDIMASIPSEAHGHPVETGGLESKNKVELKRNLTNGEGKMDTPVNFNNIPKTTGSEASGDYTVSNVKLARAKPTNATLHVEAKENPLTKDKDLEAFQDELEKLKDETAGESLVEQESATSDAAVVNAPEPIKVPETIPETPNYNITDIESAGTTDIAEVPAIERKVPAAEISAEPVVPTELPNVETGETVAATELSVPAPQITEPEGASLPQPETTRGQAEEVAEKSTVVPADVSGQAPAYPVGPSIKPIIDDVSDRNYRDFENNYQRTGSGGSTASGGFWENLGNLIHHHPTEKVIRDASGLDENASSREYSGYGHGVEDEVTTTQNNR